jgi:uncharacterized protein (UPF0332 family)
MTMGSEAQAWLTKSERSLAGAISEHANGRYDNSVNRCYYACFQAAIAALLRVQVRSTNPDVGWGHGYVQSQFNEQLIRRRKAYPAELADTLTRLMILRRTADYHMEPVSESQARRALRRAREFVAIIQARGHAS